MSIYTAFVSKTKNALTNKNYAIGQYSGNIAFIRYEQFSHVYTTGQPY